MQKMVSVGWSFENSFVYMFKEKINDFLNLMFLVKAKQSRSTPEIEGAYNSI